ncbi:MAG TPA: protein kinase [Candidatus Babeliales bacterium]|nr:protein kinase [Candidatus Babeliales bacterium]
MATVLRLCPTCGAEIPPDAPEGACPGCLLETGLGLLADASVAGVDSSDVASAKSDDPGRPASPMPATVRDDVAAASHGKKAARAAEVLGELGDYELLEEVGRGGQGVVFRARQKSLNRTVALKVISLGHWASKTHLKRFRREAEAAASLDHPGIVPIYEVGERDGSCYFSMKFVEGGQLDEVVRRKPMSIRQAAGVIAKVARTVHYAHEHGILHRDIKPGNILLDAKGEPLLTDFGLARLVEFESTITRTMDVMGTPSYMAPEQAVGNNAAINSATDVYGLGAVLYQLLTSHPPFAGGTSYETIKLLLDTEPRQPRVLNPKIDRDLSAICLKCLEKDPKRRYRSAVALAEDLEHWLKHEPIQAKRSGVFTHARKWVRRNPAIAALIASLAALAAVMAWNIWESDLFRAAPEKSIAVLPFENLSPDPENAYFADGVQDEILTNLGRIADLKVIGRTSVMQYKSGVARDLRRIAKQLGVVHLVEGSVQRAGNRVRVNAQLLDGRTDRSLWGHTYDGDLADFFVIQSQIAIAIADALHAQLSANEKSEIERPATKDITAFDLYTRAKQLFLTPGFLVSSKPLLLQAEKLLNEAVARDPSFFRAYCQLAFVHDSLYFYGFDRTPARLALAEAALETASRLRPDAGETHLARAWNLYWGHLDYNGALAELEVAHRTLPDNPRILSLTGSVQRRQGHWEESTRTFERAADLDPRNFGVLQNIEGNYATLGRYAEQQLWLGRILALEPNDAVTKAILAEVDFAWRADTRPLHQMIDSVRATNPAAVQDIDPWWLVCALAERDAAAATDALIAAGEEPIELGNDVFCPRPFVEGVIARMAGDDDKARSAFTAARAEQEKIVQAQTDFGPSWSVLGLIDAALGRKEEALREGRHAIELLPVAKDALRGPALIKYLAMIAAWVGDKDLACQQLASVVRPPSPVTYGQLKLMPFWDPLRGDPRFEKIVASLAPQVVKKSVPEKSIAVQPATGPVAEKSIAVLPFANLSKEPDSAYFADGIRAQIAARLAKIPNLQVVSGSSIHRYEHNPENVAQIAAELNVTNLLRGSVQKQGDRFRIAARLIDGSRNTELWVQSYDCAFSDVMATQNTIAREIARALNMQLTQPQERALNAIATSNPQAYQAYLKGRYVWLQRTFDAYAQAKEYFERAIALDPNYASAYAGLADAYQFLASSEVRERKENYERAKKACRRALQLDPKLPEAHASLGLIAMNYDWDWALAEQEFRSALALDPNNALTHDWYAEYLMAVGRVDLSLGEIEHARELDPFSAIINADTGKMLYFARRYEEAESQLKQTMQMYPDFALSCYWLGHLYATQKRCDEAIHEFKEYWTHGGGGGGHGWAWGEMAYAYGLVGRRVEAEGMLGALRKRLAPGSRTDDLGLAYAYTGLGEKQQAITYLEREYEVHSTAMTSLKSNPWYDSLRSDPRFLDLMRRVHLASK